MFPFEDKHLKDGIWLASVLKAENLVLYVLK